MPKFKTKIGDLFSVPLDSSTKKYFQYIANDLSQLNSDVIRAYVEPNPIDAKPDLGDVAKGEVEFHAHVVIKWGLKATLWEKVGSAPCGDRLYVVFRDTNDYGNKVEISNNWYVWRINQ